MPYKDPQIASAKRLERERRLALDPAWRARKSAVARRRRAVKPEDSAYMLFRSAKERAKAKGIDFDISVQDIVIPETCPLLGTELQRNRIKGPKASSPSLDRIDPSKGYVRGNIWVISYRANAIKHDATPDELEAIARGVRDRLALRSPEEQRTDS